MFFQQASQADTSASPIPDSINLLTVTLDGFNSTITLNLPTTIILILLIILSVLLVRLCLFGLKSFNTEEITIIEPFTKTKVKLKANIEDKKIAHKIWTELVTRKAALPFERDKDVITEVYDSWYSLFQCVREQIASIPVEKLNGRQKDDVEKLIDISTKVLNEGLRPHLTEWQAKYRAWFENAKIESVNAGKPPQEIQRHFEQYEQLVSDLVSVNKNLVTFADELKKIVRA